MNHKSHFSSLQIPNNSKRVVSTPHGTCFGAVASLSGLKNFNKIISNPTCAAVSAQKQVITQENASKMNVLREKRRNSPALLPGAAGGSVWWLRARLGCSEPLSWSNLPKIRLQRQLICIRKMTLTRGLFSNRAEQLVQRSRFKGCTANFLLPVCWSLTTNLDHKGHSIFENSQTVAQQNESFEPQLGPLLSVKMTAEQTPVFLSVFLIKDTLDLPFSITFKVIHAI